MPRGYRLYIVALGLILACTNYAYAKSGNEQADAQQSVAASLDRIASRYDDAAERAQRADQEEGPCGEGKYGSNSDLCAQWKAADAASDSAWWAWAAAISSIVGTAGVVAALGIGWHSNYIARDTAKRQLRAYIGFTNWSVKTVKGKTIYTTGIQNFGQTPAYRLTFDRVLTTDLDFDCNRLSHDRGYAIDIVPGGDWTDLAAEHPKTTEPLAYYADARFYDAFGKQWGVRVKSVQNEKMQWHIQQEGHGEYEVRDHRRSLPIRSCIKGIATVRDTFTAMWRKVRNLFGAFST